MHGKFHKFFLIHFNIHIANDWQPNIDSEINQIRSIQPDLMQSLFFSAKGPPGATAHAYN